MTTLFNRYKAALLSDAVNSFRDLWATEPIARSEIVSGHWNLYELALREDHSQEFLEMIFEVGFIPTCSIDVIDILAQKLSSKSSHLQFLLEKMDHETMRYWRHPETNETLLERYMFAYIEILHQSSRYTASYMVNVIGITVGATVAPKLIRYGYVDGVKKAISHGVIFESIPIYDMLEDSISLRTNGFAEYRLEHLDIIASMIQVLLDAGYDCLTTNVCDFIVGNGFHAECPALAALFAAPAT